MKRDGGKKKAIEMNSAQWLQTNPKAMETVSFMFFGTGRKGSTTVMTADETPECFSRYSGQQEIILFFQSSGSKVLSL